MANGRPAPEPQDQAGRPPAEAELRAREQMYAAIHDHAPFAIALLRHPEGTLVQVNEAWERMFGVSRREALGRTSLELGLASDPERRARMYELIREQGSVRDFELEYTPRSGERRLASFSLTRVDIGGRIYHLGTALDVTDRRRDERTLRRFELLASLSRDVVIFMRREDGRILEANSAALSAYGYAREELLALAIRELRAPGTEGLTEEQMAAAEERGILFETVHRRKDGSLFPVEVSSRGAVVDGTRVLLSVIRDITGRRESEAALRKAHAQLVEEDRRKSDFLAVLSHELRNPLAPIRNGLLLLERAPPESDAARRAREVLRRQTDHLTRLVDDLLDVTRLAHGKIELRLSRLDAREVVRRAFADAVVSFEQRGVELLFAQAGEPIWVEADEARLAQMVGNLLGNALKFTPPGGQVRVSVQRGEGCEVSVRDNGLGIDPAQLERIFERFYQIVPGHRGQGGMGIGLALVRELADKHGGAVRAESEGPGRGARFTIRLPLAAPPAPPAEATAAAITPSGLSVLVVEDHPDTAAGLADLLELSGHEVRVRGTGRGGVEAARERAPDVLLCDVGLPDVLGHEVIRAVRQLPAGDRILAVALTGYAQPQDRREALAAGFDAHLAKPPPLEELEQLLGQAMERKSRS